MALRAGYYGIKKSVLAAISNLSGAKVIKSIGDGLKLTSAGKLSCDIDTDTLEFKSGKLSVKGGYNAELLYNNGEYSANINFTDGKNIDDYDQLIVYIGGIGTDKSSFPVVLDVNSLKIMAPYKNGWAKTDPHIFYAVYTNDSIRFTLNEDGTGLVITERSGSYSGILRVYGVKY